MNAHGILGRPLLWIVAAGVGAVLLIALASVLANSLALAEQPGRTIGIPAVSVQPGGVSTSTPSEPTAEPSDKAAPTTEPTAEPTPASSSTPELVPAPDPVIVDDHGGDNPDHDDDAGNDSSGSGSSGSNNSGSNDD